MSLTWVDNIQNGKTHGRVELIESMPFCLKNSSSKVWISFSLIFQLNNFIRVIEQTGINFIGLLKFIYDIQKALTYKTI
jgi:hypothetical protein